MNPSMASNGLPADADGGHGLPLFADVDHPPPSRRLADTSPPFEDPLLREIAESRPLQRLRRIGFLGAVDRIHARNRHNRYDHSLGVARLALLYAKVRHLSRHDTRILAVAGLLHDVGHGPLSHTLEPVFQSRFGISHHKAGFEIIRGESSLGREIPEALARHGVDPNEVNAMIDGTHHGRYGFLFSSPINLDTIEGITRCRSFFLKRSVVVSAEAIVRTIAEHDTLPTPVLDSFWLLKHQMYNLIIHHPLGLLYDGLAQAIVAQDIDRFTPNDFLKDEKQLRRTKRRLFAFLDCARRSPGTLRKALPSSILSHEIKAPIRTFVCNTSVELKRSLDLVARYTQSGTFRKVAIDELLPKDDPTKCPYHMRQEQFSMTASFAPIKASNRCETQHWIDLATLRDS